MRILFLARWFPYPPNNGSKIRIFNILRQLSEGHDVTLIAFDESADKVDVRNVAGLSEYCRSVVAVPYRGFRPSSPKALLGLFSNQPRFLVDTFSKEMAAMARAESRKHNYDLIIASGLDMVPYSLALEDVPAVLEEVELSVFKDAAEKQSLLRQRLRSRLTWLKLKAYLQQTLPRFAACTVVSEAERENLRKTAPSYANVRVIPNALDLSLYEGYFGLPHPNTLVFPGALTYRANYDAVHYFLSDAYPAIVQAVPDLTLRVTGNSAGVDMASLPRHEGVQYTGYVPDIRPVVAQSWLSVVPLRIGGGTRLKILEAMALGTPVVSTSKGAEGLEVTDGENVLIADDSAAFAAKVIDVLKSRDLRHCLAIGGRRLVESKYDWRIVGKEFCELVEQAVSFPTKLGTTLGK